MNKISILEGKNRFSQVIASAAAGEPQIITKNGKDTAVVISFEEYRRMSSQGTSLVELLMDNPVRKYGLDIDITRDKDTGRDVPTFNEDE